MSGGKKQTIILCVDALICGEYLRAKKTLSPSQSGPASTMNPNQKLYFCRNSLRDSAKTRYKLKSNAATRIKSPFSERHTPHQKFKSAGPDSFSSTNVHLQNQNCRRAVIMTYGSWRDRWWGASCLGREKQRSCVQTR